MNDERKRHTPEKKVAILRRHLVGRVAVSTLGDEHQLHPTVFYRWLKQFFENGAAAFGPVPRADQQVETREQRIAFLETKLKKKDEVLTGLLDGYSRYLVHEEIREPMTGAEVEIILQRAREPFPGAAPRIISDNGPQFLARDFKEFIRLCGDATVPRDSPVENHRRRGAGDGLNHRRPPLLYRLR